MPDPYGYVRTSCPRVSELSGVNAGEDLSENADGELPHQVSALPVADLQLTGQARGKAGPAPLKNDPFLTHS